MSIESVEKVEVLVVGGGQAGLAISEHLSGRGIQHVVLERDRIAERWRSERWDTMVANGPAWHDRFPNMELPFDDPDGFAPATMYVEYFEKYAEQIAAPVRCGVEVHSVCRNAQEGGFRAETSAGTIDARYVVAATGPFQRPVIPAIVPEAAPVLQMHSAAYRTPSQLPEGAVLVVGGGSSGGQIANELKATGRKVFLSVSEHERPPRRYRGRDFVWWLGVLGGWDAEVPASPAALAVSGANGGQTVDYRNLEASGITLLGTTASYADGTITFAGDLGENIEKGDAGYLAFLEAADAYVARTGIDLPEEPEAHVLGPMPAGVSSPTSELNLAQAGITSIVWATGYALDFGWLQVDAFDEDGNPAQRRGVSTERGVYFLGLGWMTRRASPFIWGVWHDAAYVADHINSQAKYLAYDANVAAAAVPVEVLS